MKYDKNFPCILGLMLMRYCIINWCYKYYSLKITVSRKYTIFVFKEASIKPVPTTEPKYLFSSSIKNLFRRIWIFWLPIFAR